MISSRLNVSMKLLCTLLGLGMAAGQGLSASLEVSSFLKDGTLTWANAFPTGVCVVESTTPVSGAWTPIMNVFTTNSAGATHVALPPSQGFFRLLALDVSASIISGFSNLTSAYGSLTTIAGLGEFGTDGINFWDESFEGGFATNANLSRPHFAMADGAGNVFIVDKDSHSVLKVTGDGRIHTVAGTHIGGFNGDGPTPGTNFQLSFPNGLWVRPDGTAYILDTGNSRVCRLDTNSMITTLFTVSSGIAVGRGLWVKEDESVAYFCSGTNLRKWVPGKISTLNNNFTELGNIFVNATGDIVAADRGANKVYLVDATGGKVGSRTRLFGDGSTNRVREGTLAASSGLYGVRGVWPVPTGGYVLALHEGAQVLYIDGAGMTHVLLDGQPGDTHGGDGGWFYAPGFKVGEARSVTMDSSGNLLIVENDFGYVRKIEFRRLLR